MTHAAFFTSDVVSCELNTHADSIATRLGSTHLCWLSISMGILHCYATGCIEPEGVKALHFSTAMVVGATYAERRAPVCNAAVEAHVKYRQYQEHRKKISRSRTTVDNMWTENAERKLQTSRHNVKREQHACDRAMNIDKENMRLLLKMHEIERRAPPTSSAGKATAQLVLGMPTVASRSASLPPSGAGSKAGARSKELRRIDSENQKLLKRLQTAKSSVNISKMDTEHRAQQRIMRMRCEHQHPDWKEVVRKERVTDDADGPEDADVARIEALTEDLRRRAGETLVALADSQDMEERPRSRAMSAPRSCTANDANYTPASRKPSPIGGRIPIASQRFADQVLREAGLLDHPSPVSSCPEEPGCAGNNDDDDDDAEDAVLHAKAMAEQAFRRATAACNEAEDYGAGNAEMLSYADVVQRAALKIQSRVN